MKKKMLAILLAMSIMCTLMPAASAATDGMNNAAQALYDLGLFQGVGNNADGTPDFAMDRVPTRAEAVTMLVRLLGKDAEAKAGTWETPFTDVADWAKPYVGYAYANGLTTGTSATTFGGEATVNATQYLTFVLRALGYTSGTDFQWDSAWTKSDEIKLTNGEYNANTTSFTRGDVARISEHALYTKGKGESETLGEKMGKFEVLELTPENLKGVWKKQREDLLDIYDKELIFDGNSYVDLERRRNSNNVSYETGEFTVENGEIASTWYDSYTYRNAGYTLYKSERKWSQTGKACIIRFNDGTYVLQDRREPGCGIGFWMITYEKIQESELTDLCIKAMEGYKAENPTVEIIFANTTSSSPVVTEAMLTHYEKNYSGTIDSTWKMSNFHYDVSVNYDKTCTVKIYISGEWLKEGIGGNASGKKSCDIEWQLYDENEEYVIDSGTIYSPKVYVGEKFKDASDVIWDLPAGTYILRMS